MSTTPRPDPALGDWLLDDTGPGIAQRPERRIVILRRIDLWSALKVSLALYLSVFALFLAGGVALWMAARQGGVIGNLEHLFEELGAADAGTFHLRGGEILRMTAVIGPILVVLASLATVVGVALFNLVARLFGGVELTVVDGDRRPG